MRGDGFPSERWGISAHRVPLLKPPLGLFFSFLQHLSKAVPKQWPPLALVHVLPFILVPIALLHLALFVILVLLDLDVINFLPLIFGIFLVPVPECMLVMEKPGHVIVVRD